MEASYAKEPFDLRLLLLRLGRNLWKILALTILGTVPVSYTHLTLPTSDLV